MSILTNRRILVVEDEFLIAAELCDMLEAAYAIVIGPAVTVREAMQLVQDNEVEAAIVDMNLSGQCSDPIAEELRSRGIPFVFTTGYEPNEQTDRLGITTVTKPYSWEELEEHLGQAIVQSIAHSL